MVCGVSQLGGRGHVARGSPGWPLMVSRETTASRSAMSGSRRALRPSILARKPTGETPLRDSRSRPAATASLVLVSRTRWRGWGGLNVGPPEPLWPPPASRVGLEIGEVFDVGEVGEVGEHLGVGAKLGLEGVELVAELGGAVGRAQVALQASTVPLRGEGAHDLFEDDDRDLGELFAARAVPLRGLAGEGEER